MVVNPPVGGQTNVQSALAMIQTNSANFLQVTGGSMTAIGNIAFTVSAAKATRLNGTDPAFSVIDNFSFDAGVY